MKRLISLLLVMFMCISLLPAFPIYAADEDVLVYEYDFTRKTSEKTTPLNLLDSYDAKDTTGTYNYDITGRNWHYLTSSSDEEIGRAHV